MAQIGRVLSLKTIEQGFGHENSATPPTLSLLMLVTGASGNFTVGNIVSATGSDGSTSMQQQRLVLIVKHKYFKTNKCNI